MKLSTLKILTLLLAIAMSLTISVSAEDSSIIYHGVKDGFEFNPGSIYTESDLFDGFKSVMPGDTLTETITVENKSKDSDYIKLYMRAEAHDEIKNPLSPGVAATGETVATMTDFLSQLSMRVYNRDQLIYEASPDELDGLAENVLLGTFRSGESTVLTVELDVPEELGNEYAYRTGEVDWVFLIEAFDYPAPPPTISKTLTVHKIWNNDTDAERPDEIVVNLLKNGQYFNHVVLNEYNQWTYTWNNLNYFNNWSVIEAEVPEGYEAKYDVYGNLVIITNTKVSGDLPETNPTEPQETEPDDTQPDVTEPIETEPKETEPGEIPGPDVPPDDRESIELTVVKEWSGDEDNLSDRPESVGITLYDGPDAVETVILSAANNWTYTWSDLSANGEWSVLEVEIPEGYTPSYEKDGSIVTVTNTATLIQTGQLNWPIPVLSVLGLILILIGVIFLLKKKKKDEQAQ